MEEVLRRTSLTPLAYPHFVLCLLGMETLLDYPGRAGTISIVQWNLRPVIFREKERGVENSGEGKTYHKTHSKNPVWTPPPMIRFPPPPFVFALLFSLEETGTDQANPTS